MRLFAIAFLSALVLAGCGPQDPPSHNKPGEAKPKTYEDRVGAFIGLLRWMKNEYAKGVRDGKVVDQKEFDEAMLMGIAPAEKNWKGLRAEVEPKDAALVKLVDQRLAELRQLMDAKADPSQVQDVARAIFRALEGQLSGGSPALKPTIASVAAADADILAEVISDDYRLGVVAFAPRAIGRYENGTWSAPAPKDATDLLGIVVREKGSKRPLASTKVTVDFGKGPIELGPIWGDYPLYGANVALPEGPFSLKVDVEPPKICRHGDVLAAFRTNGRAEFRMRRDGAEVTVEGHRPTGVIGDYNIGCDVEQAMAESIEMKEAGDYNVGWIAEGPEPIWVWKDGKLEDRPAKEDDTHHLEVALLEKGTNRIVQGATVTLSMKNKATGATREVEMHNLLSEFAHYGQTLKLEEAEYTVTVTIVPPRVGMFEEGKFKAPVTTSFEWTFKKEPEKK